MTLLSAGTMNYAIGAEIPLASDWEDQGTVIAPGSSGSWDVRVGGSITPGTVIKKGGTYFLYYVGADGDRSTDGGPRHRALGVATSEDGIHFTKYSGNPIITYLPNNNEEEGVFSAAATLDDAGNVVLYYSACNAGSQTSESVTCAGFVATSANGLDFVEQGTVLSPGDSSVWGYGDELFPVGTFHTGSTWYLYYIAKGVAATWDLGLASGSSFDNLANTQAILTDGSYIVGGLDPVALSPNQLAVFVVRDFASWITEVRTTTPSNPAALSAPVVTYDMDNVKHVTPFFDSSTDTWYMYYLNAAENAIGVMTTGSPPATSAPDTTPPDIPGQLLAE